MSSKQLCCLTIISNNINVLYYYLYNSINTIVIRCVCVCLVSVLYLPACLTDCLKLDIMAVSLNNLFIVLTQVGQKSDIRILQTTDLMLYKAQPSLPVGVKQNN
jgi:hypothetical protein